MMMRGEKKSVQRPKTKASNLSQQEYQKLFNRKFEDPKNKQTRYQSEMRYIASSEVQSQQLQQQYNTYMDTN